MRYLRSCLDLVGHRKQRIRSGDPLFLLNLTPNITDRTLSAHVRGVRPDT